MEINLFSLSPFVLGIQASTPLWPSACLSPVSSAGEMWLAWIPCARTRPTLRIVLGTRRPRQSWTTQLFERFLVKLTFCFAMRGFGNRQNELLRYCLQARNDCFCPRWLDLGSDKRRSIFGNPIFLSHSTVLRVRRTDFEVREYPLMSVCTCVRMG